MIQFPKRRGLIVDGADPVPVIVRAGPRSIHTQKREKVDVNSAVYGTRSDSTRILDAISRHSRGVNSLHEERNFGEGIPATNPFKISVSDLRYEQPSQTDQLALSRRKFDKFTADSNPSIGGHFSLSESMDKKQIQRPITTRLSYENIIPSATYKIELPQELFTGHAVHSEINNVAFYTNPRLQSEDNYHMSNSHPYEASKDNWNVSQSSAPNNKLVDVLRTENVDVPKHIAENIILHNISSNFTIAIDTGDISGLVPVQAALIDKINIAIQSSVGQPISLRREDGTYIRLKDYNYKVVQTNPGRDTLVLSVGDHPEIKLGRNMPLYAVQSGVTSYTSEERMNITDPITRQILKKSAHTAESKSFGREDGTRDYEYKIKLGGMGDLEGRSDFGYIPTVLENPEPTLRKKKASLGSISS